VTTYQQPETKQTLLQCYILVVALMVTESELDYEQLELLRREMKLTRKAIGQRLESLGAKIIGKLNQEGTRIQLLRNGKSLDESVPRMAQRTLLKRKR